MILKMLQGSKKWPYQFITRAGSVIRVGGVNAFEDARNIVERFFSPDEIEIDPINKTIRLKYRT